MPVFCARVHLTGSVEPVRGCTATPPCNTDMASREGIWPRAQRLRRPGISMGEHFEHLHGPEGVVLPLSVRQLARPPQEGMLHYKGVDHFPLKVAKRLPWTTWSIDRYNVGATADPLAHWRWTLGEFRVWDTQAVPKINTSKKESGWVQTSAQASKLTLFLEIAINRPFSFGF